MNDDWSKERLSGEYQRIFELLSQETRHLIVQFILGHPQHLMSLTELDYAVPKSHAAIRDQLDTLVEAGILDQYRNESSEPKQDLPIEFYGPTERGVETFYEFKYLRGVPILRSLYHHTQKPPEILRHETAPRPDLPEVVAEALSIDDEDEATEKTTES